MSDAPCKVCGYNGPDFYQPKVHACPGNKNWRQPMTQPSDEMVERVARVIDPSSWAVMDGYLADMKRKYRGENAAYDPDNFKHKPSMKIARTAIAATGLVEEVDRVREEAFRAGCEVGLGKAAWADVDVLWQEYQALAEKPDAQ